MSSGCADLYSFQFRWYYGDLSCFGVSSSLALACLPCDLNNKSESALSVCLYLRARMRLSWVSISWLHCLIWLAVMLEEAVGQT
jgi:hypothetical protein